MLDFMDLKCWVDCWREMPSQVRKKHLRIWRFRLPYYLGACRTASVAGQARSRFELTGNRPARQLVQAIPREPTHPESPQAFQRSSPTQHHAYR
jgi:hypothetical protein